jgi:mitogen-activated protein kinase kinase 3
LDKKTNITVGDKTWEIQPEELEVVNQLGRGAYGIVEMVKHRPSGHVMALKRITAMSQEQKRLLMDMDVLDKGTGCPNIVKFYGALFWEGDLWIFMEAMDTSLDKFYKKAFKRNPVPGPDAGAADSETAPSIPEPVLGKIAASVVKALYFLYEIKIIHRDVKPSNILTNRKGQVKLCDFGISGYLENSIAKTYDAGCKPYMAPERINPDPQRTGYDIRSDVWSLGITMMELAIGKFPYSSSGNFFQQLKRVCQDEPPRLPQDRFSPRFEDFIVQCLQKEYQRRPYYSTLSEHPFVRENLDNDISEFVSLVLESDGQ